MKPDRRLSNEHSHAFSCRRCGVVREVDEIRVFKTDECADCGPGPLCLKCCTCHEAQAVTPAFLEFAL